MAQQIPFPSWGLYPDSQASSLSWVSAHDPLPQVPAGKSLLLYGLGRSYGDSCLNDQAYLVPSNHIDHFLSFDPATGVLRCEAGVALVTILKLVVTQGWFLPVTPGTKFVTVGGAIANDIHGKNHHCDGNFGHHVRSFELLRSDGTRRICSPREHADLFHATIGGLGLTGAITWAEIQLKRIQSPFIAQEVVKFRNLKEFFRLSAESERDFMYTVSWVDCLAKGENLGRGLFMRGNHAPPGVESERGLSRPKSAMVPIFFPNFALNPLSVRAFNLLYYNKQQTASVSSVIPYDPFFYPLDAIHHWNRIYGRRGFLQWQCVVPFRDGEEAIREIFHRIAHSKLGSFLAVLKTFGSIPSIGLLSFPREGVTLALDFPNVGSRLFKLLEELDQIVLQSRGAIYPAKDARMSPVMFEASFPRINEFEAFTDPHFSSSFWRRVREGKN